MLFTRYMHRLRVWPAKITRMFLSSRSKANVEDASSLKVVLHMNLVTKSLTIGYMSVFQLKPWQS